ncbi:hypothetical protein [Paenibacillus sp. LHD-38]|uniref:hypothetical protein n=1 Tax=Paenibacillus sp. LHD-38 TaxID=3072143 RepID=UPI00280E7A47|nr:hypothetical protein [Paenibacillus sp. LHD-38]MDQ8739308.1 hypothetical protein [Paenibacillus sp. LHD-38]
MNMRKKINTYSIFFSMLSWGGFYLSGFTSVLPVNGHIIILWMAIFALLMSVFGLGGINNWKSASSSLISILLSGLLVVVELLLFVFSKFLSLT